MLKKTIATLLCLGCCWLAYAQTSPEILKEKYEANKRDIKVVTEYVKALKDSNMKKEAEVVVREYMARCPVLQVEDKDTYLLINSYVFGDPYSNVFEQGIYAVKKMKWDREEKVITDERQARLMNIFKGMGSGVSGGDEIDKRYEALLILSNNLEKEINRLCTPKYNKGKYVMPEYETAKVERLKYLVDKGELLGQDGKRVKLIVAKELHTKDYSKAIRDLCGAAELGVTGVRGNYLVEMLSILACEKIEKEDLQIVLDLVQRLCEQEQRVGGTTNYYNVLGSLYHLNGDEVNGDKYTQMGNAIEAEKIARFGDLMKAFDK